MLVLPVLGVAVIDKDHLDTVDLIAAAAGAADDRLPQLMDQAAHHLVQHFGREEALMDECGFFAAHCHKEEHQRVLAEAKHYQDAAALGQLDKVRTYLTQDFPAWLLQHAETMDTVTMMAYRSYAAQNGRSHNNECQCG